MFWGPKKEIKIVDCPGLVCPSLAGLEIQAMAGSTCSSTYDLPITCSLSAPNDSYTYLTNTFSSIVYSIRLGTYAH